MNPNHPTIPLDERHQLLLDGFIIERTEKMTRRVNPVRKLDAPVIHRVQPWEPERLALYGSVIRDPQDGLYKAWVSGWTDAPGVWYFTSADGMNWDRPAVGQPLPGGGRSNRIAGAESLPAFYELIGVVRDDRDPDPSRRYKMAYLHCQKGYTGPDPSPHFPGQLRGAGFAFSADGVAWQVQPGVLCRATIDGGNYFFYDGASERWVFFGRARRVAPEIAAAWGHEAAFQRNTFGRAVCRAESADFLHWQPNDIRDVVLAADLLDGPNRETYSMLVFPYQGLYIGLPQIYWHDRDEALLDLQLAVSRDGKTFQRLSDRSAFISVGPVGAWDRFNNSVANNPPLAVGGELRFYYSGQLRRHAGPWTTADNGAGAGLPFVGAVGMGSVKTDRFAGMEASFDAGTLLTRPLVLNGATLRVNAAVPFGRLEVSVLDADGAAIEGMSAAVHSQDALDAAIPLGDLARLAGRPVRLFFRLLNGRFYSFWMSRD